MYFSNIRKKTFYLSQKFRKKEKKSSETDNIWNLSICSTIAVYISDCLADNIKVFTNTVTDKRKIN